MWQAAGTAGPWAAAVLLAGFFIWLVLTGRLIARSQLKDVQADRDKYRDTADTMLKASLEQGMTQEKLVDAVEKLLDNDEAILHVVQEIQRAGAVGEP